MNEIYLSVIVPAFNESARLGASLERMTAYLKAQSYTWEIVIVDDGSEDRTAEEAARHLAGTAHRILRNPTNRGKGYSVRRGMMEAKGRYRLFTDADLSTPIEETAKFLGLHEHGGFECVIGSRGVAGSRVEIHQNLLRETAGKIFNRLARLMSFRGIADSQCGFKSFSARAAGILFGRQKLDGFSFDAEILYLAQKLNFRIAETPVVWRNNPQSRVRFFRDSARMFADLLKIRWLHRGL